jgi:hypothetical protein
MAKGGMGFLLPGRCSGLVANRLRTDHSRGAVAKPSPERTERSSGAFNWIIHPVHAALFFDGLPLSGWEPQNNGVTNYSLRDCSPTRWRCSRNTGASSPVKGTSPDHFLVFLAGRTADLEEAIDLRSEMPCECQRWWAMMVRKRQWEEG